MNDPTPDYVLTSDEIKRIRSIVTALVLNHVEPKHIFNLLKLEYVKQNLHIWNEFNNKDVYVLSGVNFRQETYNICRIHKNILTFDKE